MKNMRKKEKTIGTEEEMNAILKRAKYISVAMCHENEPYLVTLSHGYDEASNCIYFHCAGEGRKIDILKKNPIVWGQALDDHGYVHGKCSHLYATVQFRGTVQFVETDKEKRHGLDVMIESLEETPQPVKDNQVTEKSLKRVTIGRIDIDFFTGKKSKSVVIEI